MFLTYVKLFLESNMTLFVALDVFLFLMMCVFVRQVHTCLKTKEFAQKGYEPWTGVWVVLASISFLLAAVLLVLIVIALTVPSIRLFQV